MVYFYFYYYLVSIASAANVSAQVNSIPMLNGTNFKVWKEAVEIVLSCMDLDLALTGKVPLIPPSCDHPQLPDQGPSGKYNVSDS